MFKVPPSGHDLKLQGIVKKKGVVTATNPSLYCMYIKIQMKCSVLFTGSGHIIT